MQTLRGRLRGVSEDRIADLVAQLNDHRVINMGSLQTMMTAHGAQDMRGTMTPFGKRLVSYLKEKTEGVMARRGDGIYQRGRTWWLGFTHEGKRHVVRIGKVRRLCQGEGARGLADPAAGGG